MNEMEVEITSLFSSLFHVPNTSLNYIYISPTQHCLHRYLNLCLKNDKEYYALAVGILCLDEQQTKLGTLPNQALIPIKSGQNYNWMERNSGRFVRLGSRGLAPQSFLV